jgi:leucine dehydrogenase
MAIVDLATKGVDMSHLKSTKKPFHTPTDSLFRYAEVLNFGDVHVKFDPKTGLRAIVAIHNLKLGPAIGGCRFVHYDNTDAAIEDALRLGYMMSYKAAVSNLPHGGAKAVIMKPKIIKDRTALLRSFGDFVNDLGGRYITAMDSGTSEADMDIIAERTKFVTCTSASGAGGDPSPTTAFGVRRSIEAAVKFKLGRDNIEGVHVTIQGAGHVGYYLAKELHALGARMTICDINPKSIQRCVDEFGVSVCGVNEIYDIEADVFAPCALGKVLNLETIKRLKVGIVAGSANNQLAHQNYGTLLHERGILYAPDFVANAGGLIYVAAVYDHGSFDQAHQQVSDIYHTLMPIFERSITESVATNKIAEQIAIAKLT